MIAVVPLRAGSKGLPGKNLRPLGGVALWRRAVDQGLRVAGRCAVSTDIEAILGAPPPPGCVLVRRPAALATDDAPMGPVLVHLVEALGLRDETLALLQATSPLRADDDVRAALRLHAAGGHDTVLSVTRADPKVLKWGRLEGTAFRTLSDPRHCFANRQDLPPVHAPNGAVYVFRADAVRRAGGVPHARLGAVEMPPERARDVDTAEDLAAAEAALAAGARRCA